MEQEIKSLIESNYKHTKVHGILVEKSVLFKDDDVVTLRCSTSSQNPPRIALRILNKYSSVRLVHFTADWIDGVYTRETLSWAGYKVKQHEK